MVFIYNTNIYSNQKKGYYSIYGQYYVLIGKPTTISADTIQAWKKKSTETKPKKKNPINTQSSYYTFSDLFVCYLFVLFCCWLNYKSNANLIISIIFFPVLICIHILWENNLLPRGGGFIYFFPLCICHNYFDQCCQSMFYFSEKQ